MTIDTAARITPDLLPLVRPVAGLACHPRNGIVSGNWARTEGLLRRSRYEPGKFMVQPIVNTAGGMLYSRETALDLLASPERPYMFCDATAALWAYVAGRVNARHLGSLAIHRVLSPGGLKVMFATRPLDPPPPEYLPLTPCQPVYAAGNNFYMPGSRDLTTLAHRTHASARARRFPDPHTQEGA